VPLAIELGVQDHWKPGGTPPYPAVQACPPLNVEGLGLLFATGVNLNSCPAFSRGDVISEATSDALGGAWLAVKLHDDGARLRNLSRACSQSVCCSFATDGG
jgi:hypothetical protein